MNRALLSKRISSLLAEVSRLSNALCAMNTMDLQRYPENYELLSTDAALRAEQIACRMRHLVYGFTTVQKHEYLTSAANVLGITITAQPGLVEITLPGLLPKKKQRSAEYLTDPLEQALGQFVKDHPLSHFESCIICFCHIYAVSGGRGRIRDYDNLEMKQILDVVCAYYKHDAPVMSDLEYDRLMDELVALEEESGVILSGSPTQRVAGEILEILAEVRHTKPMLSAAKTKSLEDLKRFASGRDVLLSWKMDGLTLVLRYENGHLAQAITRGRDGIIGEDVTHTVKTFLNVPLTIPILEAFEVRGEGVISWKNFDAINAELDDAYSHPRNLAAGSVRKLDASEVKKRRLEFWAFDLVSDSLESGSKRVQQQLLARCGFSVVPYLYLPSSSSAHDLELAISSMQPAKFAYPVDGLIMEYDDLAYGKSLGATGHHENRLIALKWADELYETTFRSVELATTRTGMVSLTARFDPVNMDGATVSRAYLHNLDNFRALQLGPGDTVWVYRANMIIPQIADNLTKSGTYRIPMYCPCCGAALEVGETTGGTHQLFCWNRSCTAKLVQKFVHFCDKSRMNIEGLSETTLEKLIGHG